MFAVKWWGHQMLMKTIKKMLMKKKTKNYFNDCFGPCLGIVVHGVLRRARVLVIQRLYQWDNEWKIS